MISEKGLLASVPFFWFPGLHRSAGYLPEVYCPTGYYIFTRHVSTGCVYGPFLPYLINKAPRGAVEVTRLCYVAFG